MTTKYGRITKKDLQRLVDGINTVMGMPQYPFIDREPKAGCFHLGENVVDGEVLFRLQRMSLQQESAGFTCVFGGSYLPKQAAYEQLYHYLRGIEEGLSASLQICQPVRTKALRPILEMQV